MAKEPNKALAESTAAAGKLQQALGSLATVLAPAEAEEPILAPSVRAAVYEWMAEINARDDLAAVGLKPRSTALLYGPPGTGKTTLAHHLSARLNIPMVSVGSENVISKFLGESGSNAAEIFLRVKKANVPCVLFFDEFDAIGATRSQGHGGAADNEVRGVVSVLLRHIERFDGIFIAATNLKDMIDPALWRRFGMQISVDLPDWDSRWAIIARYLHPYMWEEDAISLMASYTEGAAPSLLRQLCEGIKRALVLGPRLRRFATLPGDAIKPLVSSIAVHPLLTPPPLWSETEKCLTGFSAYEWPPVLKREDAA